VAQNKRKGRTRQSAPGGGQSIFYIVLGVIAVAGIAAIFYAVRGGNAMAATEPVALDITDARELYDRATPKRLGDESAPNRVVVFSDFQCPACAAFALAERPKIMPWVERGEAQYIAYDFPLGVNFVHGFLASRAARCAGDQPLAGTADGTAFWPYHDRLYQQQPVWSAERSAENLFIDYARELGMDGRAFEQCLRSDRHAEVVTANRMVGDQLGVRGTPTVMVNNRRVGGRTIGDMGAEVIRMLEEATGQEATATP
jgi:protein-disulfide isomerase